MDEAREVGRSLRDSEGTVEDFRRNAEKNLRAYAFALLKKVHGNGLPSTITEDNLDIVYAKKTAQTGSGIALQRAGTTMYQHLDSVVDNEIPEPTLEKLVMSKEIGQHIAVDNRELVNHFRAYMSLDKMVKHYEATRQVQDENGQRLIEIATLRGIAESVKKDFANEPAYVQEGFALIAADAYRGGLITEDKIQEYALPGLKAQVEEVKKAYESLAAKKGTNIATVVRDALKETKKLPLQQFEHIYQVIYAAEKGLELAPAGARE